ncbi:MAG: ATP-binding cassette domain-containing protein, partial [Clostridia bacterium]|nr:ATP-binding cassette domain-containing protein [Clostridia bacterium]
MKILELEKIGLTYFSDKEETRALDNISFSLENGEFVSIVGPSGCGKTSILSIISGLVKPTDGNIIFNNNENSFIGYMFQKDNLLE